MKVLLRDWNGSKPTDMEGLNVVEMHTEKFKEGVFDFTLEVPIIEVESLEALVKQLKNVQLYALPAPLGDGDVEFEAVLSRNRR